jgi:flagellar export protein FliJ
MSGAERAGQFHWRLEAVRRTRQWAEDQRTLDLSRALMRRAATTERLRALREEAHAARRALVGAAHGGATGATLAGLAARVETLLSEEAATMSLLRAEESQVERERALLVEATRARKVLDRLEERQREEHRRWVEAVALKQADDLAAAHRLWSLTSPAPGGSWS